ncbi:MAG: tetratricopeptide repeat protein, partial [Deltaproteobacteria bacterium]|nr:tetratricopeptide repeat protein [Deltaproteobacteria bacterium]
MPQPIASPRNLGQLTYFLVFITFFLIGLALYSHTLEAPFYLDDTINIQDRLYAIKALSPDELGRAAFEGFAPRRPLANLSFALNYYFHGLRLPGYHWVNIVIHIMNGALLYLFIFKTITLPEQPQSCRHPVWIALLSSLLWFVNPVETQAITYIVQRMTSMATLFFMGSFVLYVYGRVSQKNPQRAIFFLFSVLCWVLSAASKEIALTLPALIFVYEWLFFQDLNMTWLRKSTAWLVAGFAGLLAVGYFFYHYTPASFLTEVLQPRAFTALERFFTETRVVFLYLSLIVYPHPERLNLNHDIAASHSLFDPMTTLVSFAGLLALLILTLLTLKRCRIVAFSLIWFFANVAIEAMAADIELMFEHRAYLPSMLFFLPFVWLLSRWKKPGLAFSGVAVAIVIFSFWTYQRNALWNDEVSFWEDAVRKSPNHYRGYANLGVGYLHAKEYGPAQEALEKALSLGPPYPTEIHVNVGLAHLEQGQLEAARENLNRALALNRNNYVALDLLGTVSRREKDNQQAAKWYEQALEINPEFATSYHNLAILHKETGDADKALKALKRAIALRPMSANAYGTLGLIQAEQGDYD